MKKIAIVTILAAAAFMFGRLSAQEGAVPSCLMCESDYIPAEEIARYLQVGRVDNQIRSIDIGKANVQIGVGYRGKLDAPAPRSVAAHNLVTEIYVVLSGSGTNRTGPDLVNTVQRPPDHGAVVRLNGPGSNSEDMRNAVTNELKAGDVLVIPAGTGHQFTKIDDHISYLMVRVDPDKVVPLLDAEGSEAYLQENLPAQ